MVTVIIPTLNEEKTIRQVIELVAKSTLVTEILVVDDKSLDDTIGEATMPLTKIYTSTKLGKGASMREGMLLSSNEILVFLDADIPSYPPDIIELLTLPLINDEVDFVKSCFDRQAGRENEHWGSINSPITGRLAEVGQLRELAHPDRSTPRRINSFSSSIDPNFGSTFLKSDTA
jgi:glycosyltransferase involved in cell wall biosynthesis